MKLNKFFNIISGIISISLIVASFVLFYFINRLNVLDLKFLILIGIILIIIYAIIIFKLFRKKTRSWSKIVFYIISILLIFIYFILIKYLLTTINFFENITVTTGQKQSYSVIVIDNDIYNDIIDLNNKKIGFLSTNPYLKKAKSTLEAKSKIKFDSYEKNITDLIIDLNNKDLDAIVIDNSMLSILRESQEIIINNIKTIYTYNVYINEINKSQKVNVIEDPFIFYISGSDSRNGLSDTYLSDVNIVVVVNPKTHTILLINIPRDTYVQLHGTTGPRDKLTHAGMYGINMSTKTIEDLLDIKINYYAKVGFNTLINGVDAIGGIDINSTVSFSRWSNGEKCIIKKGTQHLNGNCTLVFSRERQMFIAGDYSRGENQQQVITAIINKLSNPSVLGKYTNILQSIDGSFETNMTYSEITSLIKSQISNPSVWKVESVSIGGNSSYDITYSIGDTKLYVTYPSDESIENAQERINNILYDN